MISEQNTYTYKIYGDYKYQNTFQLHETFCRNTPVKRLILMSNRFSQIAETNNFFNFDELQKY